MPNDRAHFASPANLDRDLSSSQRIFAGWSVTMPNYQFYAGPQRVPLVVEFASDEEATSKAKLFLEGMEVEIWEGLRLVTRLSAQRFKACADPAESPLGYWRPSYPYDEGGGAPDDDGKSGAS
jgi:hypothetical protein